MNDSCIDHVPHLERMYEKTSMFERPSYLTELVSMTVSELKGGNAQICVKVWRIFAIFHIVILLPARIIQWASYKAGNSVTFFEALTTEVADLIELPVIYLKIQSSSTIHRKPCCTYICIDDRCWPRIYVWKKSHSYIHSLRNNCHWQVCWGKRKNY